jgi:hypothetical protein
MRAEGLEAAALAMLRTLGGVAAQLLLTQPATASGLEGLGMSAPALGELALEPVLLRTTTNGKTLYALATAATVRKALGETLAEDASELAVRQTLEQALLRVNGNRYRITAVAPKWHGGVALLYELEIEA